MTDTPTKVSQITIEDVTYDLGTVPDAKSKIVIEKRADILVGVKLGKLVTDLNITSELIHLAYNATPEKYGAIRGNIDKLHINFGDICGECSSELGYVREAAQTVSLRVADAYKKLYSNNEVAAIAILSTCKTQADELSGRMAALAAKFDNLTTIADQALMDSQTARGEEISNRDEIKKTRNGLEADQANLTTVQEKLDTLIKQLDEEYSEAKDNLAVTEERAFTLSIVGAVMGPIGQGLGTAGAALASYYANQDPSRIANSFASGLKDQSGNNQDANTGQNRATPSDLKKVDEAKELLDEAELDLQVAEDDVAALKAAVDASESLKSKVDTSEASEEDKKERKSALDEFAAEARSKQDEASMTKAEAERLRDEHKKKWEAAKQVVEALGVAVSEVGSNLQAVGSDYFELAGQQRKQVRELFKAMLEKQDAEREALGRIEEITIRLAGLDAERQTAEITISALFQTIGALKQVVAILHEASAFWDRMQKACQALATSGVLTEIKTYTDDAFADMDRVDMFYSGTGFKTSLMNNLAKWVALGEIAREYIDATVEIREVSRENFKQNLTPDKAAAVVSTLAKKLLKDISDQVEDLNGDAETVRQAIKNLEDAENA